MDYSPRHIRAAYPAQVEAVRRFLTAEFGKPLPESEDFDRDAVLFKAPSGGLITVSEEFLADFSVEQIEGFLDKWNIARDARRLPRLDRLIVTTEGTFVESQEH